jgi:hypothetical protein
VCRVYTFALTRGLYVLGNHLLEISRVCNDFNMTDGREKAGVALVVATVNDFIINSSEQ